jgi:5-methylthioadenosine/S-adenosylhomocysteine deaminase
MTGPAAVHLTRDDIGVAARHGCVESIRSGVTTLVDVQYVHVEPGMTDAVVEAFQETGMRGFVCRGFMTMGEEYEVPAALIEEPEAVIADTRAAIRRHNRPGGRVQVGVAPCMIWTVDAESYRKVRALADEEKVLVTTHLAETDFEIEQSDRLYGKTDTELMSDIGFFGPDVLAVHCVQCGGSDIALLKRHDVKVSHNPCSNLYLASGCPPIPEMLAAGLTVGLGSDGPASNNNHSLIQAMKFAALLQKGVHRDATIMTAEKVMEMATIDGARAVGLEAEIGSIEAGKKADIAIVDTGSPFMTPIHNPVSALVYSALGNEVWGVMIDGRFVMRDGVVLTVDEHGVRCAAQSAADALAKRADIDHFKRRPWNAG